MPSKPKPPARRVGLMRIREHCVFTWQQPEGGGQRSVEVLPSHCAECVAELQKLGWKLIRKEEKNSG